MCSRALVTIRKNVVHENTVSRLCNLETGDELI